MSAGRQTHAMAHGKINLYLGSGGPREDGYHELATVFQTVDLAERVTATPADDWGIEVVGERATASVPLDSSNLVLKAAYALHRETGKGEPTYFVVDKNVPVAAGMGGGSADAAAALMAFAGLWEIGLDRTEMLEIARGLGADVPFAVQGGTALGVGRGDELAPVLTRQSFHWVLAFSDRELSTPAVYRRMDELREGDPDAPKVPEELLQALAHGTAEDLAPLLHNDLADAAIDLAPDLASVLAAGTEAGVLAGMVSGSGPTLAFLVSDSRHAMEVAILLSATPGVAGVARTTSPHPGARLVGT